MLRELRTMFFVFSALFALTGIGYPLLTLMVAQGFFRSEANGSMIKYEGTIIGSRLIGQNYARPGQEGLFKGRPSAAGDAGYDAMNSSGSNLAPGSAALEDRVKKEAERWRDGALVGDTNIKPPLPVDLVTTSASGLDPEISVEAARFQVPRVSTETRLPPAVLFQLVSNHTAPRTFTILGEPRVNVLELNLDIKKLIDKNTDK